MSNLDELSVPPSMYSFSLKDDKSVPFNLRKLHLSKLSIYMECFDENSFFDMLETMMPKKLEALTLYGNFYQLKRSKKYAQWRKFERDNAKDLLSRRPEAAPLAVAPPPPRIAPEAPPPPVRRDRIRRRPNVPTVAEEQHAMPMMIPLRADGTGPAPVAVVIPARVPPAPVIPLEQQQPAPSTPPTAPSDPLAGSAPSVLATSPRLQSMERAVERAQRLPTSVDGTRTGQAGGQQQTIPGGRPADAHANPGRPHFVHFQEVPPDTPAAANQPQAIVQQPDEMPLLNTQPASPSDQAINRPQPTVVGSGAVEPEERQNQRAAAGNAQENTAAHAEHAPNIGDDHAAGERQPDEENINMM
ncbi:hypothetical protein ANCDUO_06186 [Ancylostoma duodenale]|uniref:Uncharacterized protein n=1 Tax=Ancylostoma duodenale TaxID=51022 RepID=A0A0C2H273_9BILA|nr:hypothetical protein ANCDUO_06186 [Ancylostoma duodenale]